MVGELVGVSEGAMDSVGIPVGELEGLLEG